MAVTAATYAIEASGENSKPPRLRSKPISFLNPLASYGPKTSPIGPEQRLWRKSAAICVAGRRVPTACIAPGRLPMGM